MLFKTASEWASLTIRTGILTLAVLATLITLIADIRAAEVQIAVLVSNNSQPYNETINGFKRQMEKKGVRAEYKMYALEGDPGKAALAVQEIKKNRPALVFCAGSLAAGKTLKEISDIPVVSALVLKIEDIRRPNGTGVALGVPAETQFQWMRRFLPKAKSIGVVFNPQENKETVEEAARIAQKMGFKLDAQEVLAPKDLPAALEKLATSVDVLWGIADNLVLNPQTAKLVLLSSFRNRIPFVGPSAAWTKAGALYSLDCDYSDMGAQCAEMAQKILQGSPASSVHPSVPRKIVYSINMKTAGEMALKIPDELARNASTTY